MAFDISTLPELSWGGLAAPCETAPITFRLGQSPIRWPYVDIAGHDYTGRDSLDLKVRLFFVDTMIGGKRWFSEEWPKWWPEALLDGEPRELVHPIAGAMQARVNEGSIDFAAKMRNGVILDLSFAETRDDPDTDYGLVAQPVDPGAAAAAADANMEAADIPYPDGIPGGGSLLDAWNSIKGQIMSAGMQVTGKINQIQSAVTSVMDDVEALNDASKNPLGSSLMKFWAALEDVKKQAERFTERRVRAMQTTSETTLTALAKDLNNSLDDLMFLNSTLIRAPMVKSGTVVKYYRGVKAKL